MQEEAEHALRRRPPSPTPSRSSMHREGLWRDFNSLGCRENSLRNSGCPTVLYLDQSCTDPQALCGAANRSAFSEVVAARLAYDRERRARCSGINCCRWDGGRRRHDRRRDQGDNFREDRLPRMQGNVDGRAGARRDLLRCRRQRPL